MPPRNLASRPGYEVRDEAWLRHDRGMGLDGAAELPVLVVDGARFHSFEGFAREFSRLLSEHEWRGSLDAFNDILRGGMGTPDGGFVLRWLNAERSRRVLGYDATVE